VFRRVTPDLQMGQAQSRLGAAKLLGVKLYPEPEPPERTTKAIYRLDGRFLFARS
jgi:hypothetical protein